MDKNKLILRMKEIEKISANKIKYYCNKNTRRFIEDENINISTPIVLKTKKDAADHRIIHDVQKVYKRGTYKNIYIISNDKTFLRLAKFIIPNEEHLTLYQFRNTKLVNINNSINICFKKRLDLDHFIESYNLLKQRYLMV
jgi:uncharacterized LabA/DUF88 family protein